MKRIAIQLLTFFVCINIYSQIDFQESIIADSNFVSRDNLSVCTADVDGDGINEIISAVFTSDRIVCFENTNGQGNFVVKEIISSDTVGPRSVKATDIDGDGDIDVLAAFNDNNTIAWFENLNGMGAFGPKQIISSNVLLGLKCAQAADIDNDGDIDVLSASSFDDTIAWYENLDGLGTFGTQQIISTNVYDVELVFASDIDEDGDQDLIFASPTKIAWYKNLDGEGNFGDEIIITTNIDTPRSVCTSDIDGDGDLDILSASNYDNKIAWYENLNGLGSFGGQEVLSGTTTSPTFVYASDIDGDSDMDIIAACFEDNNLSWFENVDGLGNFGNQRVLLVNEPALAITTDDINNDGTTDIIVGSFYKVSWYNNLDGQGNFSIQHVIKGNALAANTIHTCDMDGDGDKDVLYASSTNEIAWSENIDGNGTFDMQHLISNSLTNSVVSVYPCDIDSDGDYDVVSASRYDDKIAWYENNDGLGDFGEQQVINTDNENNPSNISAHDIDGDGDNDIVFAGSNKLAWFENLNGQGSFGSKQIIAEVNHIYSNFHVADIDGDEDLDIIATSTFDNKLVWFENIDGFGNFSTYKIISSYTMYLYGIDTCDIDGDGDLDVLSASQGNAKIAWYENLDGLGDFSFQKDISEGFFYYAYLVKGADMDNDGDMDVVAASHDDPDQIVWFENIDGLGNFSSYSIITTNVLSTEDICIEDINDDGQNDVLSASSEDGKVSWYINNGVIGVENEIVSTLSLYPVPVQDILSIKSSSATSKIVFYNNLGQIVLISKTKNSIDVSSLEPGIYTCKIYKPNGHCKVARIIKI